MEWVDSDTDMESILASNLGHVLVGTDTSSLKCFSRKLLIFIRHQIDTFWKLINTSFLLTEIENTNLRTWY